MKLIRFPGNRIVKRIQGKNKVTGNGKTNTFPFTFNICTRSEERMPFLFWLMNSPDVEQLYGAVRDAGFNCGTYGFYGDIRKEEVSRKLLNLMDRMLIDGFLYGTIRCRLIPWSRNISGSTARAKRKAGTWKPPIRRQ